MEPDPVAEVGVDIVADVTIINDGSLEDLRRKVLALI